MALEALPRPRKVNTPPFVLGGESDRVFSVAEQHKTARAYGTQALLYPHMAHDTMLERGWASVGNRSCQGIIHQR